jgi:alkylated DNA nucleotide flippase Atl1
MNDKDLQVGDRIECQDGPFKSIWKVVEIIDAGAVLEYDDHVEFVGYSARAQAPNGAWLTSNTTQSFIGKAHWLSAKVVS